MWINGAWVDSYSGNRFLTYNPADQTAIAEVSRGGAEDIQRAVEAASTAFRATEWRTMKGSERGRILFSISQMIRDQSEHLAKLECLDSGKPITQARADVEVSARYFEFYGGVADKIHGETIPVEDGYFDFTRREPFGVCGIIVPWNYPLQIASRGLAPAIATGNTVVLKPAEETPLTALLLGEICTNAGLPAGVVNVVPGFGYEAGAALSNNPVVRHISFTGSVQTGSTIMASAARNITPVTLELGGKSPNIVFSDADLEDACGWVIKSIIQNAGQTCSAGSRLIIEDSVHDKFLEMVVSRLGSLNVGPGIGDTDMGPIISVKQLDMIQEYMRVALDEGAVIRCGGHRLTDGDLANGLFFAPTVLDDVRRGSRVAIEEIFGPVLSVLTFTDVTEAIDIANETEYGLVTAIHTQSLSVAHTVAERVRAGQIYVNTYGAGGGR